MIAHQVNTISVYFFLDGVSIYSLKFDSVPNYKKGDTIFLEQIGNVGHGYGLEAMSFTDGKYQVVSIEHYCRKIHQTYTNVEYWIDIELKFIENPKRPKQSPLDDLSTFFSE